MFPWRRDWAVISTYFRSTKTRKPDKHSFLLPPTGSHAFPYPHPPSHHLQAILQATSKQPDCLTVAWTIPGPSYSLRHKPHAKPSGSSALCCTLGQVWVVVLCFLVSVFKDHWGGLSRGSPTLLYGGSFSLVTEFLCPVSYKTTDRDSNKETFPTISMRTLTGNDFWTSFRLNKIHSMFQ